MKLGVLLNLYDQKDTALKLRDSIALSIYDYDSNTIVYEEDCQIITTEIKELKDIYMYDVLSWSLEPDYYNDNSMKPCLNVYIGF